MTHGVRFFDEAFAEIEHERQWYRAQSSTAEESFLAELDRAIRVVVEAPDRWPRYLARTRRYVFPTFPFSLVYFLEEHVVAIVAIASERRPPGYWTERLRGSR
jgi:hypothetical protein